MGAAVVIVSVVVTMLEFGVTEAGLKAQVASAGNPVQEKLIGLVNEPCGVTVSVNVPDCPAVIVALLGLGTTVKSADQGALPSITVTLLLPWFAT